MQSQPDQVLPPHIVQIIRRDCIEAEDKGTFTAEQLALIHRENWFRLFVPKTLGGLALSLPEAVRLEESIAWADGSVGWVVTLCAGAGMFAGYFSDSLRKEVFEVPNVCLAGSGQATGTARIVEGGYIVSGGWPYASGAPYATHFTANCLVEPAGIIQSFLFQKDEVHLDPNWKYLGLNATAGYRFTVENLFVPSDRTFMIDPAHATIPVPIYRYPFLQLAQTTIAATIAGMCRCFLDLATPLLEQRSITASAIAGSNDKGLQMAALVSAKMETLRNDFYSALEASWRSHIEQGEISQQQLSRVTESSLLLARQSRNLVDQLYPHCGMVAARTGTLINLAWRNINTASQHVLIAKG